MIRKKKKTEKMVRKKIPRKTTTIKKLTQLPAETNTGDIPSILDYGITIQEAQFISQYFYNNGDEVQAGRDIGLILKDDTDDIINEKINAIMSSPNVERAMKAAVQDGVKRSLLNYNTAMSQIANIVCADPNDVYDNNGNILQLKDMPRRIRMAIHKFKVKTLFGRGRRGEDELPEPVGTITEIELYNKESMLKTLLAELAGKSGIDGNTINFNYNQTNNTQNNIDIAGIPNEDLDTIYAILSKSANDPNQMELEAIEQCGLNSSNK